MKKPISKIGTILIIIATVILAGIAIFTAFKLYQLRETTVAPNAPSSNPKADTLSPTPTSACALSFTISFGTPTPTGNATATPTSTATTTPTPTTSSEPNSCGGTCGNNSNCASGYYCYNGFCRNPSCSEDTDCVCPGTTVSPSPTEATLPQSGTNWPTLTGIGLGIIILFGSILLII